MMPESGQVLYSDTDSYEGNIDFRVANSPGFEITVEKLNKEILLKPETEES